MQSKWGRAARWVVAGPATLVLLTGCGELPGNGPTTIDGAAGPASASPSPSPSASADDGEGDGDAATGKGCAPGGAAQPEGANAALTQDLDGDGKDDTLWLAHQGGKRLLGVETASGARFSTEFTGGAFPLANAVAGRVGTKSAVILLDVDDEARLFAVADCKIVKTLNQLGKQYSFDKSMKYGTGVGCPALGAEQLPQLVGYLAAPVGGGAGYVVTQTTIKLSRNGALATNGAKEVIGDGLPMSAQKVVRGQQIACGSGERAYEPED